MYRTRIFIIWALIVLVEAVVFYVLNYINVYVPKGIREKIERKELTNEKELLSVIRTRVEVIVYFFFACGVAAGNLIVFSILHYNQILSSGFDGLWFGHVIIIFLMLIVYMLVATVLLMAIFFGWDVKVVRLKEYYRKKYQVVIDGE